MVTMPGQSPWRSSDSFIGLASSEKYSMATISAPGTMLT